jgi:hypothetical protein
VALTTTSGNIYLQVPPTATGDFDVATDDGEVACWMREGLVTDVRAGNDSWTGVVNAGDNPVLIRTGRGDVAVRMMDNAATYRSPSPPN